ncbi:flavin reductase family protein [Paracoccaceae bacterium Fryx2]|nr:flavin reductase family protein [Paracoccaceae bacterium Fryx2]
MTETPFLPHDDPRAFRDALGRFATGVTVITAAGPGGPVGFTANSFASVSLDPPLVLWSPARASGRFAVFAEARHFTIHVIAAGQTGLCNRFVRGGAGFDGLDHAVTPEGVPVLAGALARFDCVQHATHEGGDHLIVVGRVLRATCSAGSPLVFSQGAFGGFVAD